MKVLRRLRSCDSTAFKLAFELGIAGRIQPAKVFELADDLMRAACGVSLEVNMKSTFRLSVLVLLLVLAVIPGALRGSGPAVAGDSGQLIVLDWAPFDDKKYYEDFDKKYPGAAEVHTKDDDAAIYSAVTVAGDHADIIHPYTTWLKRWVDEGLVEEIDTKRLANWERFPRASRLSPMRLKQDWPVSTASNISSPGMWGSRPSCMNTEKVKDPIDSWEALFNKRYKGHIFMFDDGPSAVEVYTYIHPDEKHKYDEKNITTQQFADKVRDAWIEQKELNLDYWTDEQKLVDAMADGNVWVAYAWPSAYDALKKKGVKVAYADPKEGRISWVGVYGILKGTKNKELALKFLDEKLSTEDSQERGQRARLRGRQSRGLEPQF